MAKTILSELFARTFYFVKSFRGMQGIDSGHFVIDAYRE